MSYKNKKSKSNKRLYIIGSLVIVLLLFAIYFLILRNDQSDTEVTMQNEAQTTSNTPTAQDTFSEGEQRTPQNTASPDRGSGYVEDKQGESTTTTDQSKWKSSETGEITVYSPSESQIISSGTEITGESSLPAVNFRLIDSVSGVISQGELRVVNGKFSGILNFNTTASDGRLDIFGVEDKGKEFSSVEISIKFR